MSPRKSLKAEGLSGAPRFSDYMIKPAWIDAATEPDLDVPLTLVKKKAEKKPVSPVQTLAVEIYKQVEKELYNQSLSIETRTELMRLIGDMAKSPVYAETVLREITGQSQLNQEDLIFLVQNMDQAALMEKIKAYAAQIQNFALTYEGHDDRWKARNPDRPKSEKQKSAKPVLNIKTPSLFSKFIAYFSKK